MIYLASSWRNELQPAMVTALRELGHEVYDFRKPKQHSDGFHWSEVMPSYERGSQALVPPEQYVDALDHPRAIEGFNFDFDAMQECSHCVLLLESGKSAHLEAGWFIGQGRPTAIFVDPRAVQPELMYKMADRIFWELWPLHQWLVKTSVQSSTSPLFDN